MMMRKGVPWIAAGVVVAVAGVEGASAATLNVDFNGAEYSAIGPTYSGQGVLPDPGNNVWNGLNGSQPSSTTPVYADGTAATGVSVALTRQGFGGFSYNFGDAHHDVLQESVLVPGWSSDYSEVTVGGLGTGTTYNLVVYSQGFEADRRTKFTVNGGPSQTTTGYAGTGSTLDLGEDYLLFPNVSPDANGALVIRFEKDSGEAHFNGFQLQAVPEPASLAGIATAALALTARRRRQA